MRAWKDFILSVEYSSGYVAVCSKRWSAMSQILDLLTFSPSGSPNSGDKTCVSQKMMKMSIG